MALPAGARISSAPGKRIRPLQIVGVRGPRRLVAAGDDAQVSLTSPGHVGQVIAHLELEEGDG